MRAFLKKLSFIVLLSLLSVLLAVYSMEKDLIFSSKRILFVNEYKDVACLITGNSHAFLGLNPKLFPVKSINIAEVSKQVDVDLKIINNHIHEFKNLKFVIIPIDYFTFHYSGKKESFSKRYYFHWNLKEKFSKKYVFTNLHFFNCGCFRGLSEVFENHTYDSFLGFSPHYDDFSKISETDQINFSKKIMETWHKYFIDTLDSDNIKNSILNLSLQLNKKNIKTIFVTMPVSKNLQKLYKSEILKRNSLLLESLLNQSGAIYINLQTNKVFENNNLFADCDHLNNNGATIASNEIKNVILNNQLR